MVLKRWCRGGTPAVHRRNQPGEVASDAIAPVATRVPRGNRPSGPSGRRAARSVPRPRGGRAPRHATRGVEVGRASIGRPAPNHGWCVSRLPAFAARLEKPQPYHPCPPRANRGCMQSTQSPKAASTVQRFGTKRFSGEPDKRDNRRRESSDPIESQLPDRLEKNAARNRATPVHRLTWAVARSLRKPADVVFDQPVEAVHVPLLQHNLAGHRLTDRSLRRGPRRWVCFSIADRFATSQVVS